MPDHVDHVFLRPFAENRTISVGTFGAETPVVERLDHKHHSHLVAELDKFRRRHVVGGADGVGSHVLQQFDLMAESSAVDGCSQRSEVVVVADTFEFGVFSVEEESLFWDVLYRADTESGCIFVDRFAVDAESGACTVEIRSLGIPQHGFRNKEVLVERLSVTMIQGVVCSNCFT